jgi:hypothetical protein
MHIKDYQRLYLLILSLGILVVLGIVIIRDWGRLKSFPWQFNWKNLGAVAIAHYLALSTLFLGWHQIMRCLVKPENWRRDFQIYSFSILVRRIPFPIWYIGSRLYLYKGHQVSTSMVLSATGLETVLITISGFICYLLFLPWYTYNYKWAYEIGGAILIIWIGGGLLRPNFLIDLSNWILRSLGQSQLNIFVTRTDLLTWGMIYLSTWLLDGFSLYLMVSAFVPKPPSLPDILGVSTISALIAIATLALPAGLWLKELTMSALLSAWLPISVGVTISICYRLAHTFVEILWAFGGYWVGRTLGVR